MNKFRPSLHTEVDTHVMLYLHVRITKQYNSQVKANKFISFRIRGKEVNPKAFKIFDGIYYIDSPRWITILLGSINRKAIKESSYE